MDSVTEAWKVTAKIIATIHVYTPMDLEEKTLTWIGLHITEPGSYLFEYERGRRQVIVYQVFIKGEMEHNPFFEWWDEYTAHLMFVKE
jgi:hypothetical protein